MSRRIVTALAALAISAGAASADPFGQVVNKITTNGTHLDGARASVPADAVSAVVLPAGTTVTVR